MCFEHFLKPTHPRIQHDFSGLWTWSIAVSIEWELMPSLHRRFRLQILFSLDTISSNLRSSTYRLQVFQWIKLIWKKKLFFFKNCIKKNYLIQMRTKMTLHKWVPVWMGVKRIRTQVKPTQATNRTTRGKFRSNVRYVNRIPRLFKKKN